MYFSNANLLGDESGSESGGTLLLSTPKRLFLLAIERFPCISFVS
jgi:hypothetical protein